VVEFNVKVEGLDEVLREFGKDDKRVRRAAQRALKDTANKAKTATAKKMTQTYTLPSKRIKDDIPIKWPTYTSGAVITFIGKPPGLQHYKPKETRGNVKLGISSKKFGGGLSATRTKKAGKKQGLTVEVEKKHRIPVAGAWLDHFKNATGVFRRSRGTKSPKYPKKEIIKRLSGPSVMGMFNSTGGMNITRKVVWDNMDTQFTKEWKEELKKG